MQQSTFALVFCLLIVFSGKFAEAVELEMSRTEVAEVIQRNSQLNNDQIQALIDQLATHFDSPPDKPIPIHGILFTHGVNVAFFTDTDEWPVDATIVDPTTGELVEVDNLFLVNFHNGGLKAELAYKWMFTFVPSTTTLDTLDGATYGRGLGATAESFIGLEGAWMPGENRPGHLFHVALKAGFGCGINFPKMEFRMRRVQRN